jgi:hypothetical protein
VQHGGDDNDVRFDGEVDGVRESPEKRSPNTAAQLLVRERPLGDAVVCCAKLIEELNPESRSFVLVPLECRLYGEIDRRVAPRPTGTPSPSEAGKIGT